MVAHRTMKPFREALAEIMGTQSLEQLELAALSDVSQSAISLLLQGRRQPRMETVEKLARALDIPPEYFVEYRAEKARRLVEDAVKRGEIDLEDIELVIERHRFMKGREDQSQ